MGLVEGAIEGDELKKVEKKLSNFFHVLGAAYVLLRNIREKVFGVCLLKIIKCMAWIFQEGCM